MAPKEAPPSRATPEPADLWALLKSVAETAALFGFFSAVLGWSYLASYFYLFGFRAMELDISSSVASIFAVNVIYRSAIPLLLALGLAVAPRAVRARARLLNGAGLLICLFLVTLGLYQLGSYLGRKTASEDVWAASSRLPAVGFYITGSRLGYPSCASATSPTVDCRLLLHGKGAYYFFEPFQNDGGSPGKVDEKTLNLHVYALPDSKVQLVEYQRGIR